MMHGHEKSDSVIVAAKPANKAERSAAELAEPRAETKGNAGRPKHVPALRNAIRAICPVCCARAASGHAAIAPPMIAIEKWRRAVYRLASHDFQMNKAGIHCERYSAKFDHARLPKPM